MYSFAETIGVIRKCLRKGVLWFIRDPTDPDVRHACHSMIFPDLCRGCQTNPLREILETPAFNQAKKITRALLVYGSIVLTCFGIFPWLTKLLNIGLFPLRFDLT